MARYRGRCHCGAIEFEAEGELEGLEICNCSLCARTGFIHWYLPPESFHLLRGEDAFETYQFGTFTSRNHFCRTCGISPFRRARSDPNQIDVNVRCLEGVDLDALRPAPFDGQNWEQAMQSRERS